MKHIQKIDVNDNEEKFNATQEDILLAKLITSTLSSKFYGTPVELFVHTKYLMEIEDDDEIQDYIITDFNPNIDKQEAIKLSKDFISLKKEFIKPDKSVALLYKFFEKLTILIAVILTVPTLSASLWIGGLIAGYFDLASKGLDAFLGTLDISAIDYNRHKIELRQADKGKWYYRFKWSSVNHRGITEMFKKKNIPYLSTMFIVLCLGILLVFLLDYYSSELGINNALYTVIFFNLVILIYFILGFLNHKMWERRK